MNYYISTEEGRMFKIHKKKKTISKSSVDIFIIEREEERTNTPLP